jgi:hypothetical protein
MIEASLRPATLDVPPGTGRAPAADDTHSSAAVIGALTHLLDDTRTATRLAGGLLTAAAVGVAVTATAWPLRAGATVCCLILLVAVLLTWVRAAVLLALAGRPVTGTLAELRRHTGAPVQPAAPWVLGGTGQVTEFHLGRRHAQSLIAAASLRQARTQLALRWAMLAAGGFCVWTAVVFALSSFG